ncbi:MAG: hypothetical protein ACRDZ7_07100 [Acidimicrobiia bacterium]
MSRRGLIVKPIGPNDLKPTQCASLNLTNLVIGGPGTAGADLVLGGPSADSLDGNAGDDCLLGGGGIDFLDGGPQNDVCIGGPLLDVINLLTCETVIQ